MVDSPCVKICELNGDGVCVGCGRTIKEIGGWREFSEARKAEVVATARRRLEAMGLAAPRRDWRQ